MPSEPAATSRLGGYQGAGFVTAFAVRLLTAALAILIPLYAVDGLGAPASLAGAYVLLLWIGNAVGVAASVFGVKNQSWSSVAGFCIVAISMAGLSFGGGAATLFMLASGVGVGLPQPFLPAFMHLDSPSGRPFAGVGLYSTALGGGLMLGPLIAYGAFRVSGFGGAFLALGVVCLFGVAGAALGRGAAARLPRPTTPSLRSLAAAWARKPVRRALVVNLLYSLLLPIFLSFGAILAEGEFGFTPGGALLLFVGVFGASTVLRLAAVRFEAALARLLTVASLLLLASTLALGLATSWLYFAIGMLVFSVPHAYIFPISNFFALSAAKGAEMDASYAFQGSSAAAEFVAPAAAVLLIPWVGVQGLFLVGAVLAVGVIAGTLLPMGNEDVTNRAKD